MKLALQSLARFALLLSCFTVFSPPLAFAQAETISVQHKAKGPKGTMCERIGADGQPTGETVIVRGFFFDPEDYGKTLQLPVTSRGETMRVQGGEAPIYHFVTEPVDPVAEKDPRPEQVPVNGFWLIDNDAALQVPPGWEVQTVGHPAPIHLSAVKPGNTTAVTVLKEDPVELEVANLEEYTALKATLLSDKFPDFAPAPAKTGEVNGLEAGVFEGPATIGTNAVTILCMTVSGKKADYLLLGILGETTDASKAELLKVMRTFRERSTP